MATIIQRILDWRPNVTIIGQSTSGKTTLINSLIRPILGPLALIVDRSTEAGIRQIMNANAQPILLDEFDECRNSAKVRSMLRTSSRGGTEVFGTQQQEATSCDMRHMVWIFGTNTNSHYEQDRNRMIVAELCIPRESGNLSLPNNSDLEELGRQARAAAIYIAEDVRDLAIQLRSVNVEGVPSRVVESFSVAAAVYSLMRHGKEEASEYGERILRYLLRNREIELREEVSEAEALRSEILTATPAPPISDGYRSVAQLINVVMGGTELQTPAAHLLESVGIKLFYQRTNRRARIFLSPEVVRRKLLKGGRFEKDCINEILLRLPNSARSQQRIAEGRPTGISLPWPPEEDLPA